MLRTTGVSTRNHSLYSTQGAERGGSLPPAVLKSHCIPQPPWESTHSVYVSIAFRVPPEHTIWGATGGTPSRTGHIGKAGRTGPGQTWCIPKRQSCFFRNGLFLNKIMKWTQINFRCCLWIDCFYVTPCGNCSFKHFKNIRKSIPMLRSCWVSAACRSFSCP